MQEMIFVDDALFVGGNDYPVEQAAVLSIPIRDPRDKASDRDNHRLPV